LWKTANYHWEHYQYRMLNNLDDELLEERVIKNLQSNKNMTLNERRKFWKNTRLKEKKIARKYLTERKKKQYIDTCDEYKKYVNFVNNFWNEKRIKKLCNKYLKKRAKR